MTTDKAELLPCPFCGGETIERADEPTMYCRDCEAQGPMVSFGRPKSLAENWNTRASTPPNPSEPLVERVAETDRVLPEAPHWNGHGKYGPALCMDECTLHIMSRGFGAKDGDGYLTHNPNRCDWERDEDGSDYVVVPLSNSDLLFLRDQLNVLFPVAALPAPADDVEIVLSQERANNPHEPFSDEAGIWNEGFCAAWETVRADLAKAKL